MKFSKNEIVFVRTIGLSLSLVGYYQLKKIRWSSNYPYQIEHEGERIILEKREVHKVGMLPLDFQATFGGGDTKERLL
jgi:hypothetical protein